MIYLKPKGWTSKSDYEAEGKIINKNGETKYHLFGKWNSFLNAIDPKSHKEIQLGVKKESPEK